MCLRSLFVISTPVLASVTGVTVGCDYVSTLAVRPNFARFLMFIVALLQWVLFGILRQKFAPGIKLVSPNVCVAGSLCRRECGVYVCALCSTGIRSVYDSDVYCGIITVGMVREIAPEVCARSLRQEVGVAGSLCRRKFVSPGVGVTGSCAGPSWGPIFVIRVVLCAFVAAGVQFDPGGPKFVTTLASRTPVSAQLQLDLMFIVIEIRVVVSSLGSWHAPFGGVCVTSVGLFV